MVDQRKPLRRETDAPRAVVKSGCYGAVVNSPVLHPLNESFRWQESTLPPRRLDSDQAQQFSEEGFFLLERGFDADEIAQTIEEIDPFEARMEAHLRTQPDGRIYISQADGITFTKHLVQRSEFLRELSHSPVILDLCHDLVGPDVRLYWDQAVYKKPGQPEEFPFHQDNSYTFIEPQQYLTCWIALTDTDENNGCPWVLPGMHRRGTLAHEVTPHGWRCLLPSEDAVPVRARAGDIVVFSSLTPHRTGPNLTDSERKSYILQYAPDGAVLRTSNGEGDVAQNDPDRQYLVLRDGQASL